MPSSGGGGAQQGINFSKEGPIVSTCAYTGSCPPGRTYPIDPVGPTIEYFFRSHNLRRWKRGGGCPAVAFAPYATGEHASSLGTLPLTQAVEIRLGPLRKL